MTIALIVPPVPVATTEYCVLSASALSTAGCQFREAAARRAIGAIGVAARVRAPCKCLEFLRYRGKWCLNSPKLQSARLIQTAVLK